MNRMHRKLPLAAAALATIGLAGGTTIFAQPTPPKDPFKDSSIQSYSTVMQSRGRLGAKVIGISEDLRAYFGAPSDRGLLIDSVLDDSPAERAGLRSGDVIVEIEGVAISEVWDVMQATQKAKTGDAVKVEIIRDKKKRSISATMDNDGDMSMGFQLGDGGDFKFDFGKGGFFDPFGHDSPFNYMPHGMRDLQEQMRGLEERLNKIDGGKSNSPLQPVPKTPNKDTKKPFRKSPKSSGNTPS